MASYNQTGSAGKKAELWSELYMPASYRCCSFQLYVYGKDPGTLNITLIDYMENSRTVVWSYTPTFGKSGVHINGQFPHVYPGKYYVSAAEVSVLPYLMHLGFCISALVFSYRPHKKNLSTVPELSSIGEHPIQ